MRKLRIAVLGMSLVATAACAAAENPEAAAEADRRAIAAAAEAYIQGFLDSDAAAAAAVLTEDVVISALQMPDIRGRAAAEAVWVEQLATTDVVEIDVRAEDLLLAGDIAVDAGEYDETLAMAGQAEPVVLSGRYVIVWQRQADGAWRIARFIATDRPAEAAPVPAS